MFLWRRKRYQGDDIARKVRKKRVRKDELKYEYLYGNTQVGEWNKLREETMTVESERQLRHCVIVNRFLRNNAL